MLRNLIRRNHHLPQPIQINEPKRSVEPIGERALELAGHEPKAALAIDVHTPELDVPLISQNTICILNGLLPLLPGDGRMISFQSRTAGVSLHEEVKITYSSTTVRIAVIGTYIDWGVELDNSKRPTAADDDVLALSLSGRIVDLIGEVINGHLGLRADSKH